MNQDEWLAAHTFECPEIRGRITPASCEEQRERALRSDIWNPCKKCTAYEERRKTVAVSQSVIDRTCQALRSSRSLEDAAKKLGLDLPSMKWRVKNVTEIKRVFEECHFEMPPSTIGPKPKLAVVKKKVKEVEPGIPEQPAATRADATPSVGHHESSVVVSSSEEEKQEEKPDLMSDLFGNLFKQRPELFSMDVVTELRQKFGRTIPHRLFSFKKNFEIRGFIFRISFSIGRKEG